MAFNISTDLNKGQCIGCGICVNTCPAKIFTIHDKKVSMAEQRKVFCINCGDCAAVCPKGIIKNESGSSEDNAINGNSLKPEVFLNFLESRRSVRSYKPITLSAHEKEYLIKTASQAPRGGHTQDIRNTGMIIIENNEMIKELIDYTYEYLFSLKKKLSSIWLGIPKALNPSLRNNINSTLERINLILKAKEENINMLTYDSPNIILLHSEKNSPISKENLTIMEYQIMLGAEAIGLGTCFLGWLSFALQSYKLKPSAKLIHICNSLKITSDREILGAFSIGQKKSNYRRLKNRNNPEVFTV